MLRTIEEFAVRIHASPRFDFCRPLWQMHLLHVKRAATTSSAGGTPSAAPIDAPAAGPSSADPSAAAVPSIYSILILRYG